MPNSIGPVPVSYSSFLGYEIEKTGLTGVAAPTRKRFVERVSQLYEQGADSLRIGQNVRRWLVWVRSGLDGVDQAKINIAAYDA